MCSSMEKNMKYKKFFGGAALVSCALVALVVANVHASVPVPAKESSVNVEVLRSSNGHIMKGVFGSSDGVNFSQNLLTDLVGNISHGVSSEHRASGRFLAIREGKWRPDFSGRSLVLGDRNGASRTILGSKVIDARFDGTGKRIAVTEYPTRIRVLDTSGTDSGFSVVGSTPVFAVHENKLAFSLRGGAEVNEGFPGYQGIAVADLNSGVVKKISSVDDEVYVMGFSADERDVYYIMPDRSLRTDYSVKLYAVNIESGASIPLLDPSKQLLRLQYPYAVVSPDKKKLLLRGASAGFAVIVLDSSSAAHIALEKEQGEDATWLQDGTLVYFNGGSATTTPVSITKFN